MTTPEGDFRDARLATEGDTRAFERLYRKHVPRVHSLARRMVGWEEADELTQDVFVRAWERLETFRGEAAFGTWIHRVAINVMLARQQVRKRDHGRFEDDDAQVDATPVTPRESEARIDVDAALRNLPEGARRVFVLHDMEGYKHYEIAEMLGITAGTSKSQLHRARMLMREQLIA
ncbi:MAG TPA: RNA polymerase sigma factor [Gemmatimonadota bacterium]|nr:RNA polymerase sigma factor [Gemmatimonadota bacterium]